MTTNLLTLTPEQQRLKLKHGTPEKFAKALRNALGEISLDEMEAGVQKYRDEWAKAGWQALWLKIGVMVKPGADLKCLAWKFAEKFEEKFRVPALYFARYTDALSSRLEISALVVDDPKRIKRFFRKYEDVIGVKIENRDPGSFSHACAYQAVKRLMVGNDDARGTALRDVFHWMSNMVGCDYLQEIRFYNWAAWCVSDMLVKQSEQAKSAQSMVSYLETEKGRAAMKKKVFGHPAKKPAKSALAVPGKASAPKARPSAGSGLR
jgi:hypothetical protein